VLDAFGDVIAAAEAVHVHPNTFRYRLHRIAEVGEVDLGDSESRFALMLQLRLLDVDKPSTADGADS
jgi:DNA-binding PucR family transcriptional regulator